LPRLLGQGGLYIDPTRPDELRWALERVLSSPELRHQMGQAAAAAAAQLTWEASARQMLNVIERVAQ
jgi:glycosyltransferase involved in cell wall biosynthesis